MRTIVVDDEFWMLKRFAIECEGLPEVQLMGSFNSSEKALEFATQNNIELAFLDIEIPDLNGIELAHKLKEINPDLIVIFISAYDRYMTEAFKTKTADYYILKPYNTEDIESAVERARLLSGRFRKATFARTFGTFELFSDNQPVFFQDVKAKELLALLIDRRDRVLSAKDVADILWKQLSPSEGETNYNQALEHLEETLSQLQLKGIVGKNDMGIFICANALDCDMYRFLDGDAKAARQYFGEYMSGYEWAEENRERLYQQSKQLSQFQDAQLRNSLCANIRTLDNKDRTITYMNDSFLSLVGYTREEIKNKFQNSFRAMVMREDYDCVEDSRRQLFESGQAAENQYRIFAKNHDNMWVVCKSEKSPSNDGNSCEISSILVDISETKEEQHALEQAARCDSLTGLYNRSFARGEIEQYLASTQYVPFGALVVMDVDNFKAVNDTYGHPFADTVLTDIAAILTRAFRSSDIICRLGGDEMMLFLKGVERESDARELLKNATDSLRERLSRKTPHGELTCSFGGAMYPQDGGDFKTLYNNADQALYAAKKKKNCTVWFKEITS